MTDVATQAAGRVAVVARILLAAGSYHARFPRKFSFRAGGRMDPLRTEISERRHVLGGANPSRSCVRRCARGLQLAGDNYARFADWRSSAHRVATLLLALDELEKKERTESLARN
jgi:ABC-type uncharacterized transport system fused permease/ATPase subunit